jgi:hypothetical protein
MSTLFTAFFQELAPVIEDGQELKKEEIISKMDKQPSIAANVKKIIKQTFFLKVGKNKEYGIYIID